MLEDTTTTVYVGLAGSHLHRVHLRGKPRKRKKKYRRQVDHDLGLFENKTELMANASKRAGMESTVASTDRTLER